MRQHVSIWLTASVVLVAGSFAPASGDSSQPRQNFKNDVAEIWIEQQYDIVHPGGRSALAVHFKLEENWHFYADGKSAPAGMNLKVNPEDVRHISFAQPIFPEPSLYFDKSSGKRLKVFSGTFVVFLPFTISPLLSDEGEIDIAIDIEGAVCSDIQCRMPNFGQLHTKVNFSKDRPIPQPAFILPVAKKTTPTAENTWADYPVALALALAVLAGLILNVMPCVWPVIPIIIMRILNQAGQNKTKSVALGLAFCLGIVLFFAALAVLNIVLRLGYATVLQWGDLLRSGAFVLGLTLLMVIMALFMFGVFTIGLPASVTGKAEGGKGYAGSIGMGFLAAILSTPCSFAILAAAFAWAQTQTLPLSTVVMLLMGLGMAAPYAVLTSMPSLLQRLPKPGRWMELFKQAMGFLFLAIAVKLLAALPGHRLIGALYFSVALAFCVWMWGGWVNYATSPGRKWTVRMIAVCLVILCTALFLPAHAGESIEWRSYDRTVIDEAIKNRQPVLIDFMAEWCLSCKIVEKTVYTRKTITELIKRKGVLPVRADTTQRTYQATIDLREVYNEPGVPVSILLVPGRDEPVRLRGIVIGAELKKALKALPDKAGEF